MSDESDEESVVSVPSSVASAAESSVISSGSDFEESGPARKKGKAAPRSSAAPDRVKGSAESRGRQVAPPVRSSPAQSKSKAAAPIRAPPPASHPGSARASHVSSSAAPAPAPASVCAAPRPAAAGSVDVTQGPPVASESAARKLILQYMKQQNRPYSVIQVFENLHQRVTKSNVQKCLDTLSEGPEADLRCKEYGKAKIYYVNQAGLPAQASESDLRQADAAVKDASARLAELSSAVTARRRAADSMSAEPEDLSIGSALAELETRVTEKRRRLEQVQATTIDEDERDSLIEEHNHYLSLWRKRRRGCLDAVDMLADGMEKPKSFVMNVVGLETDEDCGVTQIPTAIVIPRSRPY